MTAKLLDVENLTMKFGGLVAIDDLSFSAAKDQITSIIGPNGAGKTTVFNCLTGFYKATAGSMFLNKENERLNLKKFSDFKVAQKAGVARTFQNIRLFPQMSVLENLMVAQHNKLMDASGFTILGLFNAPSFVNKEKEAVEISKYWLDIIGLTHRADDDAGDLPYGDQRKLEIVRAMCINPHLLCLDEPAAGLNAKESSELNSGIIESNNQSPKFSEIIPEYLNFMRKNKRRLSSIDETAVSYQDFIEIVGDKPISDYTRNDARDYRNIISKLPKNRRKLKNYRDKSINELLKMEIPDSHILNIETQTKLNSRIIAIWNFMIDEYNDYVTDNVFRRTSNSKITTRKKKKRINLPKMI